MNGPSGYTMDDMDGKLLDMLQDDFPLAEMPFVEIGKELGIAGSEVMMRLERLKNAGYIRRIGPVLDAKKLGYSSLLCAAAAGPDMIEELAHTINSEPSVTHNYEREAELNLWFTVTMGTQDDIEKFLKEIEDRFSIRIYRFPEKRTFKIKTRFATGVED